MPDVLEVRCVLPEVLLDFGVEGMVGGDHQGRMVAHLAKVLQCLMGREERKMGGGEGRGRMYCFCVGGCSMYAGRMCVNNPSCTHTWKTWVVGRASSLLSPPGCPPPPSLPETLQSPHKAAPNRTRSRENMQ